MGRILNLTATTLTAIFAIGLALAISAGVYLVVADATSSDVRESREGKRSLSAAGHDTGVARAYGPVPVELPSGGRGPSVLTLFNCSREGSGQKRLVADLEAEVVHRIIVGGTSARVVRIQRDPVRDRVLLHLASDASEASALPTAGQGTAAGGLSRLASAMVMAYDHHRSV